MIVRLCISALLLGSALAPAQQTSTRYASPKAPPPAVDRSALVLRPGSSTPIATKPFSYFGEPLCDAEGNLYFHRDIGLPNSFDVLRISPSGEEDGGVRFDGQLAAKYFFVSFAISPSGQVYVLVDGVKPAVLSFGADGGVRDQSELEAPANVGLTTFAVFNDGSIMASGTYNGRAEKTKRGKRYLAIFEASGRLRAQLKTTVSTASKEVSPELNAGAVAIGRDGSAYVLDGGKITVVSSTGQVLRRIPYATKVRDGVGSRLNISGGLLVVVINRTRKESIDREYLVLDASTGEDLGLYTAGLELMNQDVCFSETDGFTFLVPGQSGQLTRVTAPLR